MSFMKTESPTKVSKPYKGLLYSRLDPESRKYSYLLLNSGLHQNNKPTPKSLKKLKQLFKFNKTPLRLFLIICISNSHPTYATASSSLPTILIRSTDTTSTEFSAYAETEPVKTYAQHQLDNKRKEPRPVKLQPLLKQAQMDFVSYEPNQSKNSFQLIVEQIHSFDWNAEERKIIFYSLFRLAQLEKNLQKQKLLLQEALVFGMDLKLDLQLFPPPLVQLYSQQKKSILLL